MSATEPGPKSGSGGVVIGRLCLDVPGLDAAAGARLANLVASHLSQAGPVVNDVQLPRLAIRLDTPDLDLDRLAQAIARAVLAGGS